MGNKTALILALICASIASIIVYRTMKESSKPKLVEVPKTAVIIAKITIPARSVIGADQVEIRLLPQEAVNKDFALKMEDVVGLITKSEIIQGEPVNLNRLIRKGEGAGLSFMIPPGLRAITIPIDEVLGVAGFIQPGERVDVIEVLESKINRESITWTILQDIEVLAVSQDMGTPNNPQKTAEAKVGTSVTLAVTPTQAEKIALVKEKGVIHLTLRPALKEEELNIPLVKESHLLPSVKSSSSPVKKMPNAGKVIEIISGGKSQLVTVE